MSIEPIPTAMRTNTPRRSETAQSRTAEPGPRADSWEGEFEDFVRQASRVQSDGPLSLRAWIDLAEAWKITRTLRECRGNRSAAARALGIGRRTLYAKMEKLQITPTWALGDRSPAR
jgi:DNA-binding NtrC family response regulator